MANRCVTGEATVGDVAVLAFPEVLKLNGGVKPRRYLHDFHRFLSPQGTEAGQNKYFAGAGPLIPVGDPGQKFIAPPHPHIWPSKWLAHEERPPGPIRRLVNR